MRAHERNDDRGRGERERQAESDRPRGAFPAQIQPAGEDRGRSEQLGGPGAKHQPAHAPQPPERKLQPNRKQQQDDAQLGKWLDRVGIGDGHIVEPRLRRSHRAKAVRPDQHYDQDEADDRADAEPRKSRDDDARGAKDDQRVGKAGSREVVVHDAVVQYSSPPR